LFKIFDTVWLPEAVLNELKSENTVTWVAENLSRGRMAYLPDAT
jgi:hypothetical protein